MGISASEQSETGRPLIVRQATSRAVAGSILSPIRGTSPCSIRRR